MAANLILACPNAHTTIDKRTGQAIWETDDLRRLKREHEEGIKHLTGMLEARETTVLRVAGKIRSRTPSVSKELVHAAVHADLRFPRYRLGALGSDLEIDLVTDMPDEDDPEYFQETEKRLTRRIGHVADQVTHGEIGHISLFAFARISVLVQLGHLLDDKWPLDLHPFDRVTGVWGWDPEAPTADFALAQIQDGAGPEVDAVTLVLSLSGRVDHRAIPEEALGAAAVYEVTPVDVEPGVNLFRSRETLRRFTETYLAFLAGVERDHPAATAVNVLGAVGLTPAVELGRRRTRSKHPPLRVFEQVDGGYALAAEVGP